MDWHRSTIVQTSYFIRLYGGLSWMAHFVPNVNSGPRWRFFWGKEMEDGKRKLKMTIFFLMLLKKHISKIRQTKIIFIWCIRHLIWNKCILLVILQSTRSKPTLMNIVTGFDVNKVHKFTFTRVVLYVFLFVQYVLFVYVHVTE